GRILFTAETAGRREALLELLGRLKIKPREVFGWVDFVTGDERLNICIAPVDEGLLLDGLALIPGSPLFGRRVMQRARRGRTRDRGGTGSKHRSELREGAPWVHIDHGVGRYQGLTTRDYDGQSNEFLVLQYAD